MSKYKEIAEDIRRDILDGKYNPNEQLALEKEMCEYYNVSRITIKKAVDELVAEGLVVKRRGAGTFVKAFDNSDVEGFSMSKQFCGFSETNKGKKVESKVIEFEVIHPDEEIATKLKMSCDDFVYYIIRVRYADGEPIVVEYTYMPIGVVPGIKNDILHKSIYSYIEDDLNLKIKSAHKTIRAIEATSEEKEYLCMDKNIPILEVEQVGFLDNGQPFEYSISHHRGDKSDFRSISFK